MGKYWLPNTIKGRYQKAFVTVFLESIIILLEESFAQVRYSRYSCSSSVGPEKKDGKKNVHPSQSIIPTAGALDDNEVYLITISMTDPDICSSQTGEAQLLCIRSMLRVVSQPNMPVQTHRVQTRSYLRRTFNSRYKVQAMIAAARVENAETPSNNMVDTQRANAVLPREVATGYN